MAKDTALEKKIDALTSIVKKGFSAVDVKIQKVEERMERGFAAVDSKMERGFAAVADDIADIKGDIVDIKRTMATKDQVVTLHTQTSSIENQLRGMRHIKLEGRVDDLEEKAFGKVRV